ncbi:MAG: hypothetical protein IJ150_04140, partial [Bacteroidales bacterium]|nr:hypothetical protein [Bacteroidales bacterium]
MKKIFLIISFIIGALSADAQTSDAVVREYVRLLNDWLANPYDTQKKEQIKNILKPLDKKCTMKDEIVEMYNSDAGTMETDVNGYLTIFSEKTKWQKVQIEIQSLKNSSNSGINIITAILKYSGGFELVTATDF